MIQRWSRIDLKAVPRNLEFIANDYSTAHFKHGIEQSAAWIEAAAKAQPYNTPTWEFVRVEGATRASGSFTDRLDYIVLV